MVAAPLIIALFYNSVLIDRFESRSQSAFQPAMLALFPVVLLLAADFTILIARLIRDINLALRCMGRGDFVSPAGVSGLRDLQQLGWRIEWLPHRQSELERQKNRYLRKVSRFHMNIKPLLPRSGKVWNCYPSARLAR